MHDSQTLPFRQKPRERESERELSDSLGPLTETFSSPLPAPLVKTWKSATSFTLTPFGWRPLPVALQAFGFTAESNDNKFEGGSFRKDFDYRERPAGAARLVAETILLGFFWTDITCERG